MPGLTSDDCEVIHKSSLWIDGKHAEGVLVEITSEVDEYVVDDGRRPPPPPSRGANSRDFSLRRRMCMSWGRIWKT